MHDLSGQLIPDVAGVQPPLVDEKNAETLSQPRLTSILSQYVFAVLEYRCCFKRTWLGGEVDECKVNACYIVREIFLLAKNNGEWEGRKL